MEEDVKKTVISDDELVLRAKKGDLQAMNALITKYQGYVFNLVYRHINHYDEARECTQEVFISAFKSIRSFQMRSSFKTWIYRVAVNRAIHDFHKKKRRDHATFYLRDVSNPKDNESRSDREYDIPDMDRIPYKELEKKERKKVLQQAIAMVKDIYRTPLILRDIEGLSYDEIGEILNVDLGTVKSRISRGRENLRHILFRKKEEL